MKTTNEILIIDLEATCWKNDRIPAGQKVDIIEIGICKLNLSSKAISQKQSIYVIPERSEINEFCTKLTGITPELIEEKGIYFEEACDKIREEYHAEQLTWAGYGNFDREQVFEQCDWLGIEIPFGGNYLNVMEEFRDQRKINKIYYYLPSSRTLN